MPPTGTYFRFLMHRVDVQEQPRDGIMGQVRHQEALNCEVLSARRRVCAARGARKCPSDADYMPGAGAFSEN